MIGQLALFRALAGIKAFLVETILGFHGSPERRRENVFTMMTFLLALTVFGLLFLQFKATADLRESNATLRRAIADERKAAMDFLVLAAAKNELYNQAGYEAWRCMTDRSVESKGTVTPPLPWVDDNISLGEDLSDKLRVAGRREFRYVKTLPDGTPTVNSQK